MLWKYVVGDLLDLLKPVANFLVYERSIRPRRVLST